MVVSLRCAILKKKKKTEFIEKEIRLLLSEVEA